jgi:hypothetical protein
MGRKHTIRCNRFQRGVERQSFIEALAKQLRNQKRSMAFIQMPHRGGHTECTQGARAANAQDHFLPHARGFVAAVEPMSDVAV